MPEELKKALVELKKDSAFTAIGRRKTAIARVKLQSGEGKITINDKEIANPSRVYTEPLRLTGYDKKVDLLVKVSGSGLVSQ
jgi:small subunit ribosomal protein S9